MTLIYRNIFLLLLTVYSIAGISQETTNRGFELARMHVIKHDKPAPDFFSGALLGNGGLGVVVTTRPDAIVLRFGHNNVWDIRIAENNRQKIGTFKSVFERVSKISDKLSSLNDDPCIKRIMPWQEKITPRNIHVHFHVDQSF